MIEIWKPIPGFERYQVSDHGNVKGIRVELLKPSIDYRGYRIVRMPGRKLMKVSRLVLMAFRPIKDKLEVDHINRIRGDDRLINLRWATRRENSLNRGMVKNSSSGGIPGVSWYTNKQKPNFDKCWRAFKRIDGVLYHIGYFKTIQEAEIAVNSFQKGEQQNDQSGIRVSPKVRSSRRP